MTYEVQLEVFEGPLDLLLHLVHRNEVNIADIPISLITEQYLETIELMQSLNLDVAGEYLVMAAYLVHIKSLMLLPTNQEDEVWESGEDPRAELAEHLLEYKRYKEAAQKLAAVDMLDRNVFIRSVIEDGGDLPLSIQPVQADIQELLAAFRTVLDRISRKDLVELQPEQLLVEDKIKQILDRLRRNPWLTFWSLFEEDQTRLNVVTTFLALLEIVKLRLAKIYQDTPFGTILISPQDQSSDPVNESAHWNTD